MPPDEPSPYEDSADDKGEDEEPLTFADMGLDGRLLKAISTLGWKEPTLVQEKAIPLALDGKDVLAGARTGTGKTGAYLIPILNQLIGIKTQNPGQQCTRAAILGPSKELTNQIATHAQQLNNFTSTVIKVLDVGVGQTNDMKLLLEERPDIIVSTPAKLLDHLKGKTIKNLKDTIKFLVLDEADLMFSFGYENDIKQILELIQPEYGCQCFLMSATLNPEITTLKKLCLRNPVTLKLEEPELGESSRLTQYHIHSEEEDKYVLMAALFKLKLIRGKTIVFTNCVEKCYRLKLFLEQFGIPACILNPELPVACRVHVVDCFNRGKYNTIIASDEVTADDPAARKGKNGSKTLKNQKKTEEFSASRGIDFQFVSNVINFDLPDTVTSYIHRVGRTGRGARDTGGTALSFVRIADKKRFQKIQSSLGTGADFKPYQFRMEELDSFKYRTRDALKAVTSVAVREARLKEIKREMLNSEKLKTYFQEHPKDLKVLRADRDLHTIKHQSHLKDMPDYIIPDTLKGLVQSRTTTTAAGSGQSTSRDWNQGWNNKRGKKRRVGAGDPLRTFKGPSSSGRGSKRRKR